MRLQLDPAVIGAGIGRTSDAGQTSSVGAGADSTGAGGRAASADSIQISGPSSALNRLASDRAARIDQLTALVGAGSYDVSSARVGGAIVGSAIENSALSGGA